MKEIRIQLVLVPQRTHVDTQKLVPMQYLHIYRTYIGTALCGMENLVVYATMLTLLVHFGAIYYSMEYTLLTQY